MGAARFGVRFDETSGEFKVLFANQTQKFEVSLPIKVARKMAEGILAKCRQCETDSPIILPPGVERTRRGPRSEPG